MFKLKRDRGLAAVPVVVILMLVAVVISVITYKVSLNVSYEATDGTYQAYETLTGNEISRPNKPGSISSGTGSSGSGSGSGGSGGSGGGSTPIVPTPCEHPTTEIRNATTTYTGDTYCTVCNAKLNEGYYIAIVTCGVSSTQSCIGWNLIYPEEMGGEIESPVQLLFTEGETFRDWFMDDTRNIYWTPKLTDGVWNGTDIIHGYMISGDWSSPKTGHLIPGSLDFSFDDKIVVGKEYKLIHSESYGSEAPR